MIDVAARRGLQQRLAAIELDDFRRDRKRRAIRSLAAFVRYFWHIIEPATPLIWEPYLDAICAHLEAVSARRIRNLLINIPPRHLKSTIVSVMWPAWEWLHRPSTRWLTSSFRLELAKRDARNARLIILSPEYRELVRMVHGDQAWDLSADQNTKTRYANNRTGTRICTSVTAGATGEGGDFVCVDDPHNVKQVSSERKRAAVHEWWDETMSTRGNDPKLSARVIVMQRCHEDDLSGYLLRKGGVEHLCLPTEFEPDHPTLSKTSLGYVDPRVRRGQLLAPRRMGPVEVADQKLVLGSWGYVGQHQQRPVPKGGGIFKDTCFQRRWSIQPARFDRIFQSWDLTFGSQNADAYRDRSFVVGHVLGQLGASVYVLDEVRGLWDFAESLMQMAYLTNRWPEAMKKLVEAKANGPALESILRSRIPGIELVEPKGSKIARALAIQPFAEAGGILFPNDVLAPWARESIAELTSFPFGRANDRVDSISQGVLYALPKTQSDVLARLRTLSAA